LEATNEIKCGNMTADKAAKVYGISKSVLQREVSGKRKECSGMYHRL
jgi:predicted DNA-binding protein (UPF0251 family)